MVGVCSFCKAETNSRCLTNEQRRDCSNLSAVSVPVDKAPAPIRVKPQSPSKSHAESCERSVRVWWEGCLARGKQIRESSGWSSEVKAYELWVDHACHTNLDLTFGEFKRYLKKAVGPTLKLTRRKVKGQSVVEWAKFARLEQHRKEYLSSIGELTRRPGSDTIRIGGHDRHNEE